MDQAANHCGGAGLPIHDEPRSPRDEIQALIENIARAHDCTAADVFGRSRLRGIVRARHEAMYEVARRYPWLSYPQLGRLFRRDHTSVMHAVFKLGLPSRREQWGNQGVNIRINSLVMQRLFDAIARVVTT
jgi:hypothetical protein